MHGTAQQSRARGFRILASLFVVVAAGGIFAGASVQWSAASAALPGEMFSSGAVTHAGGSVVLDSGRIEPGQTLTGSVVVANDGDAPGRFALRTGELVDDPGPAGGSLARTLRLTITDVTCASSPRSIYEGSLTGLSSVALGTLDAGAVRAYRIALTFPLQDAGSTAFAGSVLSVAFAWTSVTTG